MTCGVYLNLAFAENFLYDKQFASLYPRARPQAKVAVPCPSNV
jgi:hypothetical protein